MFSETLWIPGKRRLTNAMLSDLRAAGYYAGIGKARGWNSDKRAINAMPDRFATETAAIRKLVADEAMRLGLRRSMGGGFFTVNIEVTGHPRHDPDAWYLLGKAAIDGLVDALAIRSDRKQIVHVAGRVCGQGAPGFRMTLFEVKPCDF